MSTALRASLVLLISLAFFALAGFVYAQDDTDGNDACPSIPSIYVYVSGVKYGEKIGDKVNLYGKSCIDLENKQVAAKGHCVGPKNCKADLCGGKPCALPTGPLPSISDTSDVTGGQPPTSQTQQPAPTTNRSLLEQMIFDPTALSQQKPELSPSANSVEELLKQIDANSGLGGKVREEIGSFFSPTPLNPNQQSFQLQPRDQNGNLISQDVGPQNTMTNSDSTFAGNQEQETSQTSACDSWWSCMQERVSSAYGEALEEAAQKTTRKPFSALVPDGKGGYYLPSDARLTEAQGPPSRADADRVTGLDGPAEFKATFYTAQGTGSGEKFNGSGFASSLYPIGTAGTMEFLDKDGNVVATRQMYVNDWGNLGPGVGADLPRSTVAEVQVETGIKYVRDGVFDVRFTPEAVIQGKVAGDGWYADTAAAKAANSYVQARTGGYSPSDALAAVEQNTGAYAAYQPSDNTATPQTNVASNADVPLPRDNPFRSGGNIASVANPDLPSSAAIKQQFLNDTNTRSIALAGEPANVASSQSPQFAAVEPPETNQVTGATVRVGENTAQVNPDGSVKVTINTANETSYVKTIPADVAQALTFTEMVQSVQNQVADMPKDQDRVISNPLVFVPDAQPEVSVTPEIAPPPPVGGVNTPDVPVASVEVPKVDTPHITEAQIRERIGQSIPLDQYDKMTPLSQQLARDVAVQGIEFDQRTAQLAEERRQTAAEQPAPAVPAPSALTTLSNAATTVADWGKDVWSWGSEKFSSLFGTTPEPNATSLAEVTTDGPPPSGAEAVPVVPAGEAQIAEAPSPEIQAAEKAQLEARLAQADLETAQAQQRLDQGIRDIEAQTQKIAISPEEIQKSLDAEAEKLRPAVAVEDGKKVVDAPSASDETPAAEAVSTPTGAQIEEKAKLEEQIRAAEAEKLKVEERLAEVKDSLDTAPKVKKLNDDLATLNSQLNRAQKAIAVVEQLKSEWRATPTDAEKATIAAGINAVNAIPNTLASIRNNSEFSDFDTKLPGNLSSRIEKYTSQINNISAGNVSSVISTGNTLITETRSFVSGAQNEFKQSYDAADYNVRGLTTEQNALTRQLATVNTNLNNYSTQLAAASLPTSTWEPQVTSPVVASNAPSGSTLPIPEFSMVPPFSEIQVAEDAQLAERLARADRETAAYRQQQAPSPSPVEDVPSGVGTVLPVTPAPAGQLSNAPRAEELDKINSVFQETITDARATLATAQATAQVTKDLFGDGATTDFVQDVGVKTAQQRLDDVQARYAEYVKYMNEGGSAPAWLQTAVETARVGESPVSRELGDFKNSTHEAAYDAARDFKKELKPDGSAWSMFTSGARWLGWTTASTLAGGVQTGGEMLGVPGFNPDENRALKQAVDPIGQGIGATFDVAVTTLPFASPVSRMTALGDRGVTAVADLVAGGVTRSGVEAADVFTTAGARIVAREAADIPVVIEQTAPRVVAEVPAVVEQTAPRVVADAATAPSREIGDIGLQAVERELAAARPAPTTAELQQTIDRIAADARAAASERPAVPPSEAPPTVSPEVQKIQDAIAEVRAASEKSPIIPSEVPASTAGVTPSPVLSSEERLANALADINRGVRPLETPTSVPGVIPTNTQLPGVKIQQWADDFAVPGRVVNDDIALIDAQAARASAQPAPRVAPEAERIGAATTQQAPRDITNQGLQNLERDLARAVDDVNIASRSEPNVGVKALEDVAANINAGLPTNVSPQVKALDDLVKTLETGAQEVRAGNAEVWSSERLAALRQNADLVAQKGQQELADRMRNAADGLAGEVRPLKQIPGSNTIFDVPLEQKSFFSRTGDNIQLAWNDLKNSASDAWSNLWGRTGQ